MCAVPEVEVVNLFRSLMAVGKSFFLLFIKLMPSFFSIVLADSNFSFKVYIKWDTKILCHTLAIVFI